MVTEANVLDRQVESSREATLSMEVAGLRGQLAAMELDRDIARIRHRSLQVTSGRGATTGALATVIDDEAIVRRVIVAYDAAIHSELHADGSWWFMQIADIRRAEHEVLAGRDSAVVTRMLRDPQSNNLFYGFDNLAKALAQPAESWPAVQGALCYDGLLTLAEAVGAARLENPEAPIRTDIPDVESLLSALDDSFGFRVEFPNPFPGEVGLATSRGVASYRCFQAIYQAWRIARLAPRGKVVEIGGGLGRTAYYATMFGVRDYTIVDLPLTGAAQAYFLLRTGRDARLFGEGAGAGVRIVPPCAFYGGNERYDLVVNVDSFTEMAPHTARRYVDDAVRQCRRVLSINHEHNAHRMFDLFATHPRLLNVTRAPYWLRRGYVEELATFKSAAD